MNSMVKFTSGGPGRTRTSNQAVMSALPCPESSVKIGISAAVRVRSFTFGCGVSLVIYWLGADWLVCGLLSQLQCDPPSASRA